MGVRACAKSGGNSLGDSIYDIKNTTFVNNGRYALMAKGNNYSGWGTDCDVFLNHVTFSGCEVAIWIGDAADGSTTYNTLAMTNVLVFLSNPTQTVIRCAAEDSGHKTKVYADYNAFFGY